MFILYAMFITYLFLLPTEQARKALKIFDDSLGVDLPEKSYADDCRVFTPENP
jgi:phosphatidylserine synthase 2